MVCKQTGKDGCRCEDMTACSCGDLPFVSVLQVVSVTGVGGQEGRKESGTNQTEEKVVTVVGEDVERMSDGDITGYEEEEREPKNKNSRKETAHLGNSGNTQHSTGANFKEMVVHGISCQRPQAETLLAMERETRGRGMGLS